MSTTETRAPLDATMPGRSPLAVMSEMAAEFPAIRTIIYTGHDDAAFQFRYLLDDATRERGTIGREVLKGGRADHPAKQPALVAPLQEGEHVRIKDRGHAGAGDERTGMQRSTERCIDAKAAGQPSGLEAVDKAPALDRAPGQLAQLETAVDPIERVNIGYAGLKTVGHVGREQRHLMAETAERLAHLHDVDAVRLA